MVKKIILGLLVMAAFCFMMTGGRNYKGEWNGLGSFGYYWTSDAGNAGDETKGSVTFNLNAQEIFLDWDYPENGLQLVRCVQD